MGTADTPDAAKGKYRARPTVTTGLRLDPAIRQRLCDEAEARGVAMNWLANKLLAEAFERLVPVGEFRVTRHD